MFFRTCTCIYVYPLTWIHLFLHTATDTAINPNSLLSARSHHCALPKRSTVLDSQSCFVLHLTTQPWSLQKMSSIPKVSSDANVQAISAVSLLMFLSLNLYVQRVVVKLNILDEKEQRNAMRAVSDLKGKSLLCSLHRYLWLNLLRVGMKSIVLRTGIHTISADLKDKKLTVIGNIDPVSVVIKLRKHYLTEIVTVDPATQGSAISP